MIDYLGEVIGVSNGLLMVTVDYPIDESLPCTIALQVTPNNEKTIEDLEKLRKELEEVIEHIKNTDSKRISLNIKENEK